LLVSLNSVTLPAFLTSLTSDVFIVEQSTNTRMKRFLKRHENEQDEKRARVNIGAQHSSVPNATLAVREHTIAPSRTNYGLKVLAGPSDSKAVVE
jgi:hypothetical protein